MRNPKNRRAALVFLNFKPVIHQGYAPVFQSTHYSCILKSRVLLTKAEMHQVKASPFSDIKTWMIENKRSHALRTTASPPIKNKYGATTQTPLGWYSYNQVVYLRAGDELVCWWRWRTCGWRGSVRVTAGGVRRFVSYVLVRVGDVHESDV